MVVGQCRARGLGLTVADSDDNDDDDQDSRPEFVFDLVESDEEFDDVVNAFERDLECDAGPRQILYCEESFAVPREDLCCWVSLHLLWMSISVDRDHQTTTDEFRFQHGPCL